MITCIACLNVMLTVSQMVYKLNSGQFINHLLTNCKYYIQKNSNKSSFHSENLNIIIIYHCRNDLTNNCILKYNNNRISHLAPPNKVNTPPIHHIHRIILSVNFNLPQKQQVQKWNTHNCKNWDLFGTIP